MPAGKLLQMLNYIDVIGLERQEIAARAGLDLVKLGAKTKQQDVPAIFYSRLYLETVKVMQAHNPAVPWAAGMGTDAYRILWYYLINAKTLGEALRNAEEFQNAFYPLTGQRIWLKRDQEFAVFQYRFETEIALPFYAPPHWSRSADFEPITLLSGLRNFSHIEP